MSPSSRQRATALAFACAALSQATGNPSMALDCHYRKISEQKLDNLEGVLVTDAQIGEQTVQAVLLTNARGSMLANQGVDIGRAYETARNERRPRTAFIASMPIAPISIGTFPPVKHDWVWLKTQVHPEVGAVLGADVLFNGDFELDLAAQRIGFYEADGCGLGSPEYWDPPAASVGLDRAEQVDRRVVFDVQVNGHTMIGAVDTALATSEIDLAAAADAGIRPDSPGATRVGERTIPRVGTIGIWRVEIASIAIGDEKIEHVHLPMEDFTAGLLNVPDYARRVRTEHQPKLLLGQDFLRTHRAFFAAHEGRLYLKKVSDPQFTLDQQDVFSPTNPWAGILVPTGGARLNGNSLEIFVPPESAATIPPPK